VRISSRARSGGGLGKSVSGRPTGSSHARVPSTESSGDRRSGVSTAGRSGATIFFQLVSARYERGSIILTSNKSYGTGDRSSAIRSSRRRSWTGAASLDDDQHSGRELPAEDRRRPGCATARTRRAEAAARSLARLVPPKRAKRRRWAPLRPRPGAHYEVQGWGIFDRTMRIFNRN